MSIVVRSTFETELIGQGWRTPFAMDNALGATDGGMYQMVVAAGLTANLVVPPGLTTITMLLVAPDQPVTVRIGSQADLVNANGRLEIIGTSISASTTIQVTNGGTVAANVVVILAGD